MLDNFAILILSYGRAGRIDTIKTLREAGYTGDYYIIIDDSDDEMEKYLDIYGKDKVIIFNKDEIADQIDRGDNFQRKDIVLYARNKIWDIAESLGLQYFMMFDDDYTNFRFRFDENFEYLRNPQDIKNLDRIIAKMIEYQSNADIDTIAMAQAGDFVFGAETHPTADYPLIKRKAMNTFLCETDNSFPFMGSINEDVNAYVRLGQLGKLFFTINFLSMEQKETQQNKGGLTDIYLDQGTYVKSFYTILYSPSCIKLRGMGTKYRRIHHYVQWRNAVPKIMSEEYKK